MCRNICYDLKGEGIFMIYRNWNDINRASIIDNKICLKMKIIILKFIYLKKLLKVDK